MTEAQIQFLVKARDAHQMLVDAYAEYLETFAPPGVKTYDPDRVQWVETKGTSGPYQKATEQDNADYRALLKDLMGHDGKMTLASAFYWLIYGLAHWFSQYSTIL